MNRVFASLVATGLLATASPVSAAPIVEAETALGLLLTIRSTFGPPYLNYSVAVVDEVVTPFTGVTGIGSASMNKGWPAAAPIYGFGPISVTVSAGAAASVTGPGSASAIGQYTGAIRVTNTGTETQAPELYFYAIGKENGLAVINDPATDYAAFSATGSYLIDGYGGGRIDTGILHCSAAERFGGGIFGGPANCAFPYMFTDAGSFTFSPIIPLDPGEFFDVRFSINVSAAASSTAEVPAPATALMLASTLAVVTSSRRRRA